MKEHIKSLPVRSSLAMALNGELDGDGVKHRVRADALETRVMQRTRRMLRRMPRKLTSWRLRTRVLRGRCDSHDGMIS